MKKGLLVCLITGSIALFSAINVHAQDTTTIGEDLKSAGIKTGRVVKKGAKKVGNKTAELASKGKAAVVDKIYSGKQGPDGQTIYINNKSEYYWIDKKGHHHFVTESELKDKDN
ncbi:MAG: hypothetical protein ABIN67_09965 [Ferruginibacter sp.]